MQTVRRFWTVILTAAYLLGANTQPAHAHFLWAQLRPGTPPTLRLVFTEQAREDTASELLERIKPDRIQTADGVRLQLKAVNGALEAPAPQDTRAVVASQTWGVLKRDDDVFLLKYYAKAAVSAGDAAAKSDLLVDVCARKEGASWIATVSQEGNPVIGAQLIVSVPGTETLEELTTDARGEASFAMQGMGLCALRARVVENESGTYEGKTYTSRRYYSTLTFPVNATTDAPALKADPAAYDLLKGAYYRRDTLPKDFAGFTADATLNDNGAATTGTVTFTRDRGLEVQMTGADAKAQEWLHSSLLSAISHRMGGDFSQGDGSHAITFAPEDHSPLGRQVSLNDELRSFYRVRNNQIMEVTRTMGASRFTITMLENVVVDGDRYLPKYFVVTYFNAQTGALERTECFSDTHTRVGKAWLPASRRVVTASNGIMSTRSYELKNVRLLPTQQAQGGLSGAPQDRASPL